MYATASAGMRWLVVEMAGAWGHSAFLQSPRIIDPSVGRAVVRRAEANGMRIVAVRRPGRRIEPVRWRWAIADSRPGAEALFRGEVSGPEELLDIALDGSDGEQAYEPLIAVCAHGKHDRCCAVRGRGVTAAISAEYPDWTWECSHLGGDRFAATALILPHGLCYGRVDSGDPVSVVRSYLEGEVQESLLRGRTSYPHVVQAAQHFAREATGDMRIDALAPVEVELRDGAATVTLTGDRGPIVVELAERLSEPLLSTCSALTAGRVREFVLTSLVVEPES
ncbi:sucrase ferredoxin [Williamsia sterculiae]|uniref:Sucrase/ferredoxin-like n=1 Tax=Williamsia sterculiae TaxID=1344003 RepID=A0A1N7G7M9_9NOCA|nr:sucrase ferredoxin [Williamsia sterculiae]SIS08582.1 Sucrase/ferredoxin-like [Williamsia sterculiae]